VTDRPAARTARIGAVAAVVAAPLLLALTDPHLAPGPPALVVSTAAGALAVSALVLQPMFVARRGTRRPVAPAWHRRVGQAALALVLLHVGALFAVGVGDTLFALSPDGPTRARMALLSLIGLVVVVGLGLGRARLRRWMSDWTWRVLHAFCAAAVIVLGLGHAILTDGALDGPGTPLLLALAIAGLAAVLAARARPSRAV